MQYSAYYYESHDVDYHTYHDTYDEALQQLLLTFYNKGAESVDIKPNRDNPTILHLHPIKSAKVYDSFHNHLYGSFGLVNPFQPSISTD